MFAVPALAALVAGNNSLWAWPVLIVLVFPVAIVFAILGRHFPSAGGVAHFVGMAFGPTGARHRLAVPFRHSGWSACGVAYRNRLWASALRLA